MPILQSQTKLVALIDWCQIRIHEHSPLEVINELLNIPLENFSRQKGSLEKYKYKDCYVFGFIMLYYYEDIQPVGKDEINYTRPQPIKYDCLLKLSGEGCRQFERDVLEAQGISWKDFFRKVIRYSIPKSHDLI